jgi:hypothetical protein
MADTAPQNSKETKNPFSYTHGSYWEGSHFPFWIYALISVFPLTGFLGLDHLFIRSPQTALMKLLTNIFGLGIWYWYDVLQVVGDKDYVQKYGLSRPIVGSTGLAYQYFRDVVDEEKKDQPDLKPLESYSSLLLFVAYMATLFLPFGIANFISGDTTGGILKFLLTFSILFFIVLVWNLFDAITFLYKPTLLLEKGTNSIPPFSWLFGDYGQAWNIMKPSVVAEQKKAESQATGSVFTRLIQPILDFFGVSQLLGIVGAAKCAAEPVINQALQAASAAQTAAEGTMAIAGTIPQVATQVGNQLQAFTDPSKLKEAAGKAGAAAVPVMAGGGLDGALDSWILIAISILVAGGFAVAAVRSFRKQSLQKNDNPVEPQSFGRDDSPPQPGAL